MEPEVVTVWGFGDTILGPQVGRFMMARHRNVGVMGHHTGDDRFYAVRMIVRQLPNGMPLEYAVLVGEP